MGLRLGLAKPVSLAGVSDGEAAEGFAHWLARRQKRSGSRMRIVY